MTPVEGESRWTPVARLVEHLIHDDDLMLQWALREHGDLRSENARQHAVGEKRTDLRRLLDVLRDRARRRTMGEL